ncbi:hypothetical protein MHM83_11095 [Tenacibaculum sp. Mcav3-52]|uniref:hypothetical protein n=1 Tax=Tenacibaculum sp. Mcav3-52 TaxID=2917762 RepID=UPI001EF24C8A|nr:hypothetical protein [Tenacibaculum sp. Mcav3-52]MCG7502419.1 hypothetical protein [Tenacibaculum sp. Mcav3-52]
MINKEKKIKLIKELAEKGGITPYQIGLETSISISSATKIFNGEQPNPRDKTLNTILNYIENKITGSVTQYGLSPEITAKQEAIITEEGSLEYHKTPKLEQFKQLPIDEKLNLLYELETKNSEKLDVISSALGKALLDIEEALEPTNEKLKKP